MQVVLGRLVAVLVERGDDRRADRLELAHLVGGEPGQGDGAHFGGLARRHPANEPAAGLGEGDDLHPPIGCRPLAGEPAGLLHARDRVREAAGRVAQPGREFARRQAMPRRLIEDHEKRVVGVRQPAVPLGLAVEGLLEHEDGGDERSPGPRLRLFIHSPHPIGNS